MSVPGRAAQLTETNGCVAGRLPYESVVRRGLFQSPFPPQAELFQPWDNFANQLTHTLYRSALSDKPQIIPPLFFSLSCPDNRTGSFAGYKIDPKRRQHLVKSGRVVPEKSVSPKL
jgi:hypothetical protein